MKGLTPEQTKTVQIYLNFNRQNQHKMNPIPVCEIPVEFWFNVVLQFIIKIS